MKYIIEYLEQLVKTPSPTGMTHRASNYLIDWATERSIPAKQTNKGAVIFSFKGTKPNATPPLILTAHIDTLGAMVKEVRESTVTLVPIGGYPAMYLLGNECTIHGAKSELRGTILPKNPAVHVNSKLKELAPSYDDIEVRVDFLARKDQKLTDLVSTGDYISLDPEFSLSEGFIKSRHIDDKGSAAVLLGLAETLKDSPADRNVFMYFNVTEETGQGLAPLPDQADLLVVDMGVVGDGCQGKETHVSICAKDSSGPYHHGFTQELKQLCEQYSIDYAVDIFPYYGSDGSAALRAGNDYRVALIGPGVSASHGWERTHTKALEQTYKLLAAYIGVES